MDNDIPPILVVRAVVGTYNGLILVRAASHFDGAGLEFGAAWGPTLSLVRALKKKNLYKN